MKKSSNKMDRTDFEIAMINKEVVYRVDISDEEKPYVDSLLIVNVEDYPRQPHIHLLDKDWKSLFWYTYCFIDKNNEPCLGMYKVTSHNSNIFMFKEKEVAYDFAFSVAHKSINDRITELNRSIRHVNSYGITLKSVKKIESIQRRKVVEKC